MRWLRRILVALILFYAGLCALLFLAQRSFLFPAPRAYVSPAEIGADFMTEIDVDTPAGTVTAWWVPPSSPDGEIVMVFHGNGSAAYSNTDIFRDLAEAGHGVWSVGYPGYPGRARERGRASEAALAAAAEAQLNLLRQEHAKGRPINYYGTSLGSGVAAQLAKANPPVRLFLDAPFHSTLDMARLRFPIFPVRLLMRDPFRSDLALAELDVPLFWIHGTSDRIVPIREGRRLYEGYQGPKRRLVIDGANHVNTWPLGGREFVLEGMSGAQGVQSINSP
ncbi:MAG: alpha/beta fold hydrolase [Litorimonas sp.]